MIVHPGARTRALYVWEGEDLDHTFSRWSLGELCSLARLIWKKEKWDRYQRMPGIHYVEQKGLPYCFGRSDIFITGEEWLMPTVIVHELTHAKGFGSYDNPHSVGFVKANIHLLSRYLDFDHKVLVEKARLKNLL